jgi:regulator of sigma E protease
MHTLFGFILVLGVLVLVHEWGHFIVARLFGVRVDVFSIGFGPRLFGVKRGATDYRISAIPLGGYVRMAGQDLSEIDSSNQAPTGAPDELMSKPRWQRALISFAGPAINLVFPIFLLTGYFVLMGEPYPKFEDRPLVVEALPKESPLAAAGVVRGDRIVSVDGLSNPSWGSVLTILDQGAGKTYHLTVDHQGTTRSVNVSTAGMQTPEVLFGYPPEGPAVVSDVDPSLPAKAAGVKPGDVVESVNGEQLESWSAFVDSIQQAAGKPITLAVRRNGELVNLQITPQRGKNELGETAWMVGIHRAEPKPEMAIRKVSMSVALSQSGHLTWRNTAMVVDIVGRLVSGKTSPKQLQSVIGIASMAGKAVEAGSFVVVQFMAGLSINLGILNLLPIPILDGGNILLLTLEGIRRRDFSLRFKERFVQVGLVFLLALFAYVMYNDLMRHLPFRS